MSHSLRLTPEAVHDVDRALGYYASIRIELLIELQAELDEYFDRVAEGPLSFQSHERSHVRRAFMKKFPYGIFYIVEGDEVVVLAVFHFADDPEALNDRLGDAGEQGDGDGSPNRLLAAICYRLLRSRVQIPDCSVITRPS